MSRTVPNLWDPISRPCSPQQGSHRKSTTHLLGLPNAGSLVVPTGQDLQRTPADKLGEYRLSKAPPGSKALRACDWPRFSGCPAFRPHGDQATARTISEWPSSSAGASQGRAKAPASEKGPCLPLPMLGPREQEDLPRHATTCPSRRGLCGTRKHGRAPWL